MLSVDLLVPGAILMRDSDGAVLKVGAKHSATVILLSDTVFSGANKAYPRNHYPVNAYGEHAGFPALPREEFEGRYFAWLTHRTVCEEYALVQVDGLDYEQALVLYAQVSEMSREVGEIRNLTQGL